MKCVAPQLFRNRESREYLLAPCERWACPACGRMLAARWRAVLQWASERGQAPQYLLTLTLRNVLPLWREAPVSDQAQQKAAATDLARFLTRALIRLVAEIRQQFGPFEYVAFVELTTGRRTPGHRPHLHVLVRGPQLPSAWLSRRWQFHTHGSFRVDFQPVRSAVHAASYLVGYTVGQRKKEQQIHLTSWPGPRVRYSRGYFPARVAEIREQMLFAWRESAGKEPSEGSWEYVGPAEQHVWHRWQMAVRVARADARAATVGSLFADSREVRGPTGAERSALWAYLSITQITGWFPVRPVCAPFVETSSMNQGLTEGVHPAEKPLPPVPTVGNGAITRFPVLQLPRGASHRTAKFLLSRKGPGPPDHLGGSRRQR